MGRGPISGSGPCRRYSVQPRADFPVRELVTIWKRREDLRYLLGAIRISLRICVIFLGNLSENLLIKDFNPAGIGIFQGKVILLDFAQTRHLNCLDDPPLGEIRAAMVDFSGHLFGNSPEECVSVPLSLLSYFLSPESHGAMKPAPAQSFLQRLVWRVSAFFLSPDSTELKSS